MRFIPTAVHGVLDYLVGILLIVAPWVLGFASNGPDTTVPVVLGVVVILYSFATRYELGVLKVIPMPAHLWLDGLGGAFLAISPWLLQFDGWVWAPHVVVGVLEIGAALFSETRPRSLVARSGVVSTPPIGLDVRAADLHPDRPADRVL